VDSSDRVHALIVIIPSPGKDCAKANVRHELSPVHPVLNLNAIPKPIVQIPHNCLNSSLRLALRGDSRNFRARTIMHKINITN